MFQQTSGGNHSFKYKSKERVPNENLSDLLLDTVPGDEAVDHDFVELPNPMGPGKSLNVIVGIPIGIIDEDRVCCRQVDT